MRTRIKGVFGCTALTMSTSPSNPHYHKHAFNVLTLNSLSMFFKKKSENSYFLLSLHQPEVTDVMTPCCHFSVETALPRILHRMRGGYEIQFIKERFNEI